MKIQIKISDNELIAANKLLSTIYELYGYNYNQFTKEQKLMMSFFVDLSEFFEKKYRAMLKKHSLFTQKKLISITLKYYEAWALHQLFIEAFSLAENAYQKHQIQRIINKLDKWLQ